MKYSSNFIVFITIFTGTFVYLSAFILDSNGMMLIFIVNAVLWGIMLEMVAEDDQNANSTQSIVK